MKYVWSLVAVVLVSFSVASADDKDEKCDNASFAKKASCGNLTEVRMAKCAKDNATNAEVKEFAAKLEAAHSKAQEELKEACKPSKTECPDKQTKEGKEASEKCESLKGEKGFDVAFISMQIECHEKALKCYEKAAQECECEKMKAYATDHIPVIKEHLEMAKKIKRNLEG